MKDSAKNLLNYKYILTSPSEKHSITNSCENECICSYMNNQYRFLLSAAWHNRPLHPLTPARYWVRNHSGAWRLLEVSK